MMNLNDYLGEIKPPSKLPWKVGAMESGQIAIDSDDGKEVTGFIEPEDAYLILNQNRRIEELESKLAEATEFSASVATLCQQAEALAISRGEKLAIAVDALEYCAESSDWRTSPANEALTKIKGE